MTGIKHDKDKIRMDLLPPQALEDIARVFGFGAKKYSSWNYMKGMKFSRIYAALQRHMNAWYKGEDNDQETGRSHLAHAGCCIMMLIEIERYLPEEDDRPTHYKSLTNKT